MPVSFRNILAASACLLSLSLSLDAALAQGDARGRQIASQVSQSDAEYGDEVVEGVLTINGGSRRSFTMNTLEREPGGDRRAVVFHEPRDLAGFVSLNHSEILRPDQQWIYLPQLNRTRRLSARDKTGSFAGSEFSFEDIVRWELEKYDYQYVETVNCGAPKPCETIANIPRYEYSSYSKLVETIDMAILQPRNIKYFDLSGRHFKTLEFFDYRKVGRYWRPARTVMTNHVTNDVSQILWSNYRFGTGLSEADYNAERIERWAR
ncbi:outer membrane lipoprotein-sorting protein [Teichococcus vastitatis]|uniref:Outer membrane lipoprotein-sorting protein n=1 Tax=Teichococcus vastitatis TaxID=2307076 RepID=A0ABS9WA56_9PROT|nr:outer membrane lipoprotein-sorting protein [Pseudoroseomonas vastitatis]MCI0755770.1 outer membrane lipoprotein-sorting protein [Pseudoroseomonas vastitatis]